MTSPTDALEFTRVLELVGAYAGSAVGRAQVLATAPSFAPGAGARACALTAEVAAFVAEHGRFSFAGLDAVDLLAGHEVVQGTPAELVALIALVRRIVEVRRTLAHAALGPELSRFVAELPLLESLLAFCEFRIGAEGEVLDTASPELAQARAAQERHRHSIVGVLDQLRRQHGIAAPYTLRRERYCLPVPATDRRLVAGLVLDVSATASTMFVEPLAVVEPNNALAEAIARARAEEDRIRADVARAFRGQREELQHAVTTAVHLDAAQARASFGEVAGAILLVPGAGPAIRLVGARHPLLDPVLAEIRREVLGEPGNTRPVVPLEFDLPSGRRLVLLSGPNAGGKTVALKTIGLVALMAQAGIPVLAAEGSALPSFSHVWCHIGDEQNLLSDLSTFSAAMGATAALLAEVDTDTLVLYDELGSGTDPEEGAALAAALLEELARQGCWVVATAHLTTVAARLESLPGAVNAAMGFDKAAGRPTYRLHLGAPGRSHGLAIAATCGVPAPVIGRARSLLSDAYLAIDAYLAALQTERDRLVQAQRALEDARSENIDAQRATEQERDRLLTEREALKQTLASERERLRHRATEQLAAALEELRQARERGEIPGKKRQASLRRAALELTEEEPPTPAAVPVLTEGARVRVRDTHAPGVVSRVLGDRVEILVGGKRLWVERSACELLEVAATGAVGRVVVSGGDDAATELKLLGLTQEDAREELTRFLDRAVLAGLARVRIVHGHGTGTLRRLVRETLKEHPHVSAFAHPPQFRGGTGVTEVELQ